MRFTIITPTILRPSLIQACQSIDSQTFTDWEHIVMVDRPPIWLHHLDHPQRWVHECHTSHNNGGNTCRHNAWELAQGDYVYYCDDDNYLADENVLRDVSEALHGANNPPFALFPIERLGLRFFSDPPRSCHTDTLNLVLRRDFAQWPNTNAYGSDGVLVDALMERGVPYAAFPNFRHIAILPKISFCQ
jgi:glycosyltransferase involved in cell wall biosynthesis